MVTISVIKIYPAHLLSSATIHGSLHLPIALKPDPNYPDITNNNLSMETLNSFKGYGKVDVTENAEFRRKTRNRIIVIGISSVLLLLIVVGVAAGVVVTRRGYGGRSKTPTLPAVNISESIRSICAVTQYPDVCYSSMMEAVAADDDSDRRKGNYDAEQFFKISLQIAQGGFQRISQLPEQIAATVNDTRVKDALGVCTEMIDDSIDSLEESLDLLKPTPGQNTLTHFKIGSLRTYLSAVITNFYTCVDGFQDTKGSFGDKLQTSLRNSTQFASNSLAIVTKLLLVLEKSGIPLHRKLLATETMPYWVQSNSYARRLLQTSQAAPKADAIVDKKGQEPGQFQTIGEALESVPLKNATPFVIYVKAGTYVEDVLVTKKMWNVIMIGDGMDKTVISGSKNVVDGTPTFRTAPFIVEGRGFIGRDLGFINTAGPEKHQAVAVRTKADRAIFYRCSFDGYQDTLYTHSLRQFYRECDIHGTIDFIFGDASVVFQKCIIRPRQPLPNQLNTITAQGRSDPNENTGTSIQDCTISPLDVVNRPTFLGRPWKVYATTVVMNSNIGSVVDPKGWISWTGKTDPPATIFYAENQNTGPGANTVDRVQWAGYKPHMTPQEAQTYTTGPFLQGNDWLPESGVSYTV